MLLWYEVALICTSRKGPMGDSFLMILDDSHVTWRAVSGKERGRNGGKHGDQGMYKYHVVQLQSGICLFSLYLISVNSLCESSILQPLYNSKINLYHIIHQTFSLARDWSKRLTWLNMSQLKPGNISEWYSRVAKNIWRIIYTIASIWRVNILVYLPLDIFCYEKRTVSPHSRKIVRFEANNVRGQKFEHISTPNGGYCFDIFVPSGKRLISSHFHWIVICL